MCGICGVFDSTNGKRTSLEILRRMNEKLIHRGPDATDYYIKDNIAFGFTRLSIVDLEGGMQPLTNEDGSLVMVCNGEIFNYRELRKELIDKGHKFKTNTDIEVILHLYEEEGTAFITKLNGQFAFAIYDVKEETILCARDHVGIAPFFYTMVDGIFIFASEIKGILEHPAVTREVDLVALDQLLTFPGVVNPRTLFKNINSLENGHYLIVNRGREIQTKEYWSLTYPKVGEVEYLEEESYYIEKLDDLITQSVKRRLQADVPVGFYVSGGLDSSLISAKINNIDPSKKRHSFSIDFPNKAISESKYQRMLAQHVDSIHHEGMFEFTDIYKNLEKAVYHSESPLKETYNTASLVLSKMVREENIKVILTGEGADELFGGYVGYKFDQMRQAQPKTKDVYENELRKHIWGDENFFYEKDYYKHQITKKSLYSNKINTVFDEINCLNYPIIDQCKLKDIDLLHKRSYIDFRLRLPEHLLADHGDRVSFAHSVEGRYPFLDKDIIDFARLIPPQLKLKNFNEKYILKKIAKNLIPDEIINRPKFAFVAPGSPDLIRQNIDFISDILSYETIKKQGYFNPDTVEVLKKQYMDNNFKLNLPFESDLLIIVITFGIFLKLFNMPDLK